MSHPSPKAGERVGQPFTRTARDVPPFAKTGRKGGAAIHEDGLSSEIKKENRVHISGPGLERRVEMRLHRNRREPQRECKIAQFRVCDAPTSRGSKSESEEWTRG